VNSGLTSGWGPQGGGSPTGSGIRTNLDDTWVSAARAARAPSEEGKLRKPTRQALERQDKGLVHTGN